MNRALVRASLPMLQAFPSPHAAARTSATFTRRCAALPAHRYLPTLGITIVGGLILSQLLTLYTTPVVYLWFDRLGQRFEKYKIGNPIPHEFPAD